MKTPSVGSRTHIENHFNATYKKPLAVVTALALLALGVIAVGLLGHFNVIDLGSRSSKLLLIAGGSALLVSVIALCLLHCKKSSAIQKTFSRQSQVHQKSVLKDELEDLDELASRRQTTDGVSRDRDRSHEMSENDRESMRVQNVLRRSGAKATIPQAAQS